MRGDDVGAGTGKVMCCDGGVIVCVEIKVGIDILDDSAFFPAGGTSNSEGRVRGVACTLVISFAREQYAS